MTQAIPAQSWDSIFADVNEFRIRNCKRNANLNKGFDDLEELTAMYQKFLGIPVENEERTESGVYDNDEDEDDEDDSSRDGVLTAINKLQIENREMYATQHKKLDDLSERVTSMEQFFGRLAEDHEVPMESCVYDNDHDASLDRVRDTFKKVLIEIDELFEINIKKANDLVKRMKAIVQ